MDLRVPAVLRRLLVLPEPDDSRVQVDVAVRTEGHDAAGPHLLTNPGVLCQPLGLEPARLLVLLPPGRRFGRVRVPTAEAAPRFSFDDDRFRVVFVEAVVVVVNLLLVVKVVVLLLVLNDFGRLRRGLRFLDVSNYEIGQWLEHMPYVQGVCV